MKKKGRTRRAAPRWKEKERWETERRRGEKDREMGTERKGTEGQNERSQNGDREKLTITLQESPLTREVNIVTFIIGT